MYCKYISIDRLFGFGVVVGCLRVSRVQTPVTERRLAFFGILSSLFMSVKRFFDNFYKSGIKFGKRVKSEVFANCDGNKIFKNETWMHSGKSNQTNRSQKLFKRISSSIPFQVLTCTDVSRVHVLFDDCLTCTYIYSRMLIELSITPVIVFISFLNKIFDKQPLVLGQYRISD